MEVLERAYGKIFDLQGYISVILQDAAVKLSENSQKPGFQKILKKTLICMSSGITPKEILSAPLPAKKGDQMNVIEEVVKELIDTGRTANVLTLGLPRARSDGWLPFYPDHNYTQLITPFWSKILNIIGRDAMKELLLNTSIFIEAESSCYIQLSGDPVHSVISKKSSPDKDKPESSVPSSSSFHSSPEADDSICALSLCYDKRWYPKLRKSHPLSGLPASITGAHRLAYKIFRIKNGEKIHKSKMKRVPDRLRGSKDILKKLLSNFKTVRLEAFHARAKKEPKSRERSLGGTGQSHSSSIADVHLERDVSESTVTGGVKPDTATVSNGNASADGIHQQIPEGVGKSDDDGRDAPITGGAEDAQDGRARETTNSEVGEHKQKESLKSNSDEKDRSLELFSSPETSEPVDISGMGGEENKRSGWNRDPVSMETAYESNLGADLKGIKAFTSEIQEYIIAASSERSTNPENDVGNAEKDSFTLKYSENDLGNLQTEVIRNDKENLELDRSLLSKERDVTDGSGLLTGTDELSDGSANIHPQKRHHKEIDYDEEQHPPKRSKRNDLLRERDHRVRNSDSQIDPDVMELLSSCEEVEMVGGNIRNERSIQGKKVGEKRGTIGAENGPVTDPVSIGREGVQDNVSTGAGSVLKQCKSTAKTETCWKQDSMSNGGCNHRMLDSQSERQTTIDNLRKKLFRRLKEKKKKKKRNVGMRQWKRQISMVRRNNVKFDRNRPNQKMKMSRRKSRESEEAPNSSAAQNRLNIGDNLVNREPKETVLRRCPKNAAAGMIQSISWKTPQNYIASHVHDRNACCQKTIDTNCQINGCHGDRSVEGTDPASHINSGKKPKVERKDIPLEDSPLAVGLSGTEVSVSLRGLLKKIVPMEMWGSTYNQNRFFKYIRLLVKLGRFEKLPLNLLIRSIKVSDCQWSRSRGEDWKMIPDTDRIKRKELVETMFRWLVTDLVVPIIQLQYYVTETSNRKNELVYFPKRNWRDMEERAIADYKDLGVVSEVEEQTVRMMVIQQSTLGKSKLRFIPKEKGFRPIVRLGKSALPGKERFDINFLLRDVSDVLNYLRRAHSQFFGFSLLGVTSIYPRWREFTMKRQQEGDTRPLYFVKVDISKCYDSIPHDKLFEVMTAVLKHKDLPETYAIRRYTVTTAVTGAEGVRKKLKRYVSPEEGKHFDPRSSHQILIDLAKDGVHHKSIITNQASFHVKGVDSLLKRLRLLVYNDILCINKHDFVRTKGISHGSVLSSLLCSMFYGHMERTLLGDIDKDGLLMRLIDDFILITPHLDRATKFIETLFSDDCTDTYGLSINPSKTLTNFDHVFEGQQLQRVKDEDWFPWCGFLFNMKTLEAKNDYLRYEASSIRYSMTVSYESKDIVKTMKTALTRALLRSKGLLIFIDPVINSRDLIIENIYHLLLLTAFRFHSYFQALPQQLRNQDSGSLLKMILGIASSYHVRAKKSLSRLSEKSDFPLSITAVKWLCIKAFHVKLSRHLSVYKGLVVRLWQRRIHLSRKLDKTTRKALAKGSIPDIPAAFAKTRL